METDRKSGSCFFSSGRLWPLSERDSCSAIETSQPEKKFLTGRNAWPAAFAALHEKHACSRAAFRKSTAKALKGAKEDFLSSSTERGAAGDSACSGAGAARTRERRRKKAANEKANRPETPTNGNDEQRKKEADSTDQVVLRDLRWADGAVDTSFFEEKHTQKREGTNTVVPKMRSHKEADDKGHAERKRHLKQVRRAGERETWQPTCAPNHTRRQRARFCRDTLEG
ncbi:UNVERIFIED_CONTAM: hypothetical protein HHA_451660 [Hammondia hammondi]|eukprot:XP_008884554.1 hypothetical protein HHA_451660 [Hammondia hammondi]